MRRNLSKRYGKNEILRQITVRFESGGIYGLVGANGCGKTTLMRCICGFSQPTTGYVLVNGCLVGGRRALRRNPALQRSGAVSEAADFAPKTGVIIESPGFLPNESGLTNLMLLADMSGRADRADVRDLLAEILPADCLSQPAMELSGGMRRRVSLARAVAFPSDLVVLDEPFNAMDRDAMEEVHALLRQFREADKTILLASHSAADIAKACDIVYEMEDGRLRPKV